MSRFGMGNFVGSYVIFINIGNRGGRVSILGKITSSVLDMLTQVPVRNPSEKVK